MYQFITILYMALLCDSVSFYILRAKYEWLTVLVFFLNFYLGMRLNLINGFYVTKVFIIVHSYNSIVCCNGLFLPGVCRRSSQQINNVTLFFLFFLSLYGLLGVQLFGDLRSHCVINTTETSNAVDDTVRWVLVTLLTTSSGGSWQRDLVMV